MKLRSASIGIAFFVLAGCSGNDGKIQVEAASAALTDQGGDALFTITVVEARDEGYAFEGIHVKVTPEDGDAVDLGRCAIDDLDANQKLDQGDTLTCVEPAENRLGKDLSGKEITVELFATVDGEDARIGDASYDAK